MDRHDSAWALRGKAVLIRNRWESRYGGETELSTADQAYVVRTQSNDTTSIPEHNPLPWDWDSGTAPFAPSAGPRLSTDAKRMKRIRQRNG